MPSCEQILTGCIPKSHNHMTKRGNASKNSAADVDTELYSLHYFIKLALEGQTAALDMLHAPSNMIEEDSEIWRRIVDNREKFYTNRLNAFIGYARRQAAKYGVKGSRLNSAQAVASLLGGSDPESKLATIWDQLPEDDHCKMLDANENGVRQYQVCGRVLQETAKIGYSVEIIEKFCKNYGSRAKQAAENKGIDWKAVSHAVRAAMQVKMLLTEGTIIFPLPEAETLLKIKSGRMDYLKKAAPLLEGLMDEVEELSAKSTLPSKPDFKFWNDFIIEHTGGYVVRSLSN